MWPDARGWLRQICCVFSLQKIQTRDGLLHGLDIVWGRQTAPDLVEGRGGFSRTNCLIQLFNNEHCTWIHHHPLCSTYVLSYILSSNILNSLDYINDQITFRRFWSNVSLSSEYKSTSTPACCQSSRPSHSRPASTLQVKLCISPIGGKHYTGLTHGGSEALAILIHPLHPCIFFSTRVSSSACSEQVLKERWDRDTEICFFNSERKYNQKDDKRQKKCVKTCWCFIVWINNATSLKFHTWFLSLWWYQRLPKIFFLIARPLWVVFKDVWYMCPCPFLSPLSSPSHPFSSFSFSVPALEPMHP